MASKDTGKFSVSEVSDILESGRIREGYTESLQVEHDGENHLYFLNPDSVKAAKANKAPAVIAIDENGLERGIPIEWVKE